MTNPWLAKGGHRLWRVGKYTTSYCLCHEIFVVTHLISFRFFGVIRLQHPFSPRGKMIHFGMEALKQSQLMVDEAIKYQPSCLIRPHLYRIALTETNVKQLQETASQYPELATW